MDNEFDHHTEAEYVCEKGWDHAGFLSAIPVLIMRC